MGANGNMHVCRLVYSTRACCLTKALTPTCDPIKGTMQTASGTVDGVPTFPYTHIPCVGLD